MKRKTAIVVGSGAGGAMVALELSKHFDVTLLEEGGEFVPFRFPVDTLAKLRKTGLFLDSRMIQLLFPNMRVLKTPQDMILVKGRGVGGTTTLATGNAVRYDEPLREIGIELEEEFSELYQMLPITTDHRKKWNSTTKALYRTFEEMGLNPVVTPKFMNASACRNCGHCAIGCPYHVKWDTRELVEMFLQQGGKLELHTSVTGLHIQNHQVVGVQTTQKGRKQILYADVVVLAAGGLGTPQILQNSGIACRNTLFVDPVLCVAAPYVGARQDSQLLMPFISQQEGYILSPYMDYLSLFFDKKWMLPPDGILSLMIKFADEEIGGYQQGKKIPEKGITDADRFVMRKATLQCKEILSRFGIKEQDTFLGIVNAGHPGGMLPLTAKDAQTLHADCLPENLYVADATLLPKAMGNPPILTIMALAKKIAKLISQKYGF